MSDPIIPRRVLPQPNPSSVRRAYHSEDIDKKLALLDRVRRRQDAEKFGRKIGIVLHWLIVKPLDLLLLCITIIWWCISHFFQLMILTFLAFLLYFAGVIVYLAF